MAIAWIDVKPRLTGWKGLGKTAAIAAPLAALGATAFKVGDDFNAMRKTIIVGTGASGKALKGLEDSAKKVGKTTPSSFADVGTAIADVNTRLGLTGKPLETVSKKFLNLSRVTGTDLAGNIANVSRVFGDWGVAVKDQPAALDKLFYTSQATGIGIDKLAQQVVTFGAPMRQFGFTFEESISIMGKWEKEGVNANAVLAGLKIGLGQMSKAGKDPQKELARVSEAIKNAGSAGKANEIAIKTFGQRAGPDMAAAIREGRFEIGDMVKALENSGGSIDDADKRTRTWRETLALLRNKAMVYIAPLATTMFDAITKGANMLDTKVIPAFRTTVGFVRDNATAFKVLAGVTVALTAVTLAHGAVLTVVAAGGMLAYLKGTRLISAAIRVWAAVQWVLNAALVANPIGLVVIAVVGLIAILVLAWKKSDTFRAIVTKAFGKVKGAAMGVWNWLKGNWPKLLAILTGPIGIAVLLIAKNWDKIKSGATAVKTWVTNKFREVGSAISELPGKITALGGKMREAGQTVMSRLFAGIKAGATAVGGFVSDFASNIASAIKNAANSALGLPKTIGLGGKMGIPRVEFTIPAFARGGMMKRSGLALVGEEGPELVFLRQGDRVKSAQQTRSLARGLIGDNAVPDFRPRVGSPSFDGAGARGVNVAEGAIQVTMPATATPEQAAAAAGGRMLSALSAWGG